MWGKAEVDHPLAQVREVHSDFLTSLERDSPEDLQGAQISPPAMFSNPALPKTPAYQEVSMLILKKADPSTFLFISAR